MSDVDSPPLLDAGQADFLTGQVSILVGSCDAGNEPSVVRAYGCRVSPDRRWITVFLSVIQSSGVLRDVRAGRGVAVVFSRPSTHQTLQLKGVHAQIVPIDETDRALMRTYGEGFCAEIGSLAYSTRFAQALMSGVEDEAAGLRFAPTAAFEQTPGPAAGQPVPRTP